jgi:hypothetical protein
MVESLDCAGTDQLIPELAVGVAAGDDRARAFGHLAQCTRCRSELESVTAAADALLLLTPEHEPPLGFESRVLTEIAAQRQPQPPAQPVRARRRRLHTAVAGLAAAVLIAALGGGAVWWRTADDRQLATNYRETLAVANGRYLRAAPLLADGAIPIGHLFAYQGSPSWLLAVVRAGPGSGHYTVRMTTRDGRQIALGAMTVRDGAGTWSRTISVPVNQVLAVHLTDPHGRDMTARLG